MKKELSKFLEGIPEGDKEILLKNINNLINGKWYLLSIHWSLSRILQLNGDSYATDIIIDEDFYKNHIPYRISNQITWSTLQDLYNIFADWRSK